jgi:hypothetical protein
MEILRLDDSSPVDEPKSPLLKILLGVGALSTILGVGFAFASWLGINTSNPNNAVQFAQGVAGATTCTNTMSVTPENGFVTDTGTAGMFTLDSVYVSGINSSCAGSYFTIRVYDSNTASAPLTMTNDGSGNAYTFAKIYWPVNGDFQTIAGDPSYLSVESWDTSTDNNDTFRVVLDPNSIDAGQIVDARNIYKVTAEVSSS